MQDADLYEQLVDAAHDLYGKHPGHRALHAKASWARGTFTASAEATNRSRARHLSGEPVAALARFSNASGDPQANDASRDGRGLAVKLPEDGELPDAGRLELAELIESPERDGHIDVFDPARLVDGVEPSDDPVLHACPKAYSVSAHRRWDRGDG